MASLTIRKLDEETKRRLRVRAAEHGRSMEEEVRDILKHAAGTAGAQDRGLGTRISNRFARLGGIDLDLPPREPVREPPDLSDLAE